MTAQNKRFIGVSILLMLVGAFKIYNKGLFYENGEINWFHVFIPFGMGVLALIYAIFRILTTKDSN